jgi:hypothetical protein
MRPTVARGWSIQRVAAIAAAAALLGACQATQLLESTLTPTFDPAPPAGWAWHDSPGAHRDAIGQTFDYVCPAGGGFGYLSGTDVYTDDSSVCTAAVHTGWLSREVGGMVRIMVRPGQPSYEGTLRNGVLSESYGPWEGSFSIVAGCRGEACAPSS